MIILALETSASRCDVAIVEIGESSGRCSPRSQVAVAGQKIHSEKLIQLIDSALKDAHLTQQHLEGLAVSIGPGSFTGLRIGLSTAKGIAYAMELPMVGVPTPDAIAAKAVSLGPSLFVCQRARRDEVYLTQYLNGECIGESRAVMLADIDGMLVPGSVVVGDGVELIQAQTAVAEITYAGQDLANPDAYEIGCLGGYRLARGEADPIDSLVPLYLKPFAGAMQ